MKGKLETIWLILFLDHTSKNLRGDKLETTWLSFYLGPTSQHPRAIDNVSDTPLFELDVKYVKPKELNLELLQI